MEKKKKDRKLCWSPSPHSPFGVRESMKLLTFWINTHTNNRPARTNPIKADSPGALYRSRPGAGRWATVLFCVWVLSSSPSMLRSTACAHCHLLMGLQFRDLFVFGGGISSSALCPIVFWLMCYVVRFVHQRCWGVAWLGNSLVATSTMHVCVMWFVRNGFAISSFVGVLWVNNVWHDAGSEYFSPKRKSLWNQVEMLYWCIITTNR